MFRKPYDKVVQLPPCELVEVVAYEDVKSKELEWIEAIRRLLEIFIKDKDLSLIKEILFPDLDLPEILRPPKSPQEPEPEPEPEEPSTDAPVIPPGVKACKAEVMWNKGFRGDGVLVGILDTGIIDHPDLRDKVVIRRDFTGDPGRYADHGTHVAGTIAANGQILGVAPKCKLADYRVLDRYGSGDYDWIVSGIDAAVADGCHVINLSLGGPVGYEALKRAVDRARAAGVLVVVAAGNRGDGNNLTNEYGYPAMYSSVCSVGSVNYVGGSVTPSRFSNSNNEVDCCAQGEQVLSTGPDNNYLVMSGTSMAAPHIAGMAALMVQEFKTKGIKYTGTDIFDKVMSYAKDVYIAGRDNTTGQGFVTF